MSAAGDFPLVYSSHPKPMAAAPEQAGGLPPLKQTVKVRREKQGRAGKTVTVLFGFQSSERQLEELGKALRRQLGTGGAVKEGTVELQGDQLNKALAWLDKAGYKGQKAGG